MKRKFNWGELSIELTLLGLPYIVKSYLQSMTKSPRKSDFHPYAVFLPNNEKYGPIGM